MDLFTLQHALGTEVVNKASEIVTKEQNHTVSDLKGNKNKMDCAFLFIPLFCRPLSEESGMYETPLFGTEFSISRSYIAILNGLSIKIYSYDKNFTFKLKSTYEHDYINFVIRNLKKDTKILILKVLLAFKEQEIFLRTGGLLNDGDEPVAAHVDRKCKLDEYIRIIFDCLDVGNIVTTKFVRDCLIVRYKNRKIMCFDEFLKASARIPGTNKDIDVSNSTIKVYNDGAVVFKKKFDKILHFEAVDNLVFLMTDCSLKVLKFNQEQGVWWVMQYKSVSGLE